MVKLCRAAIGLRAIRLPNEFDNKIIDGERVSYGFWAAAKMYLLISEFKKKYHLCRNKVSFVTSCNGSWCGW